MTPNCHRHAWEIADASCQECGLGFCESCLVHSGGAHGTIRCVPCALSVAGVRRSRQPRLGWRQRRQLSKLSA